MLLDKPEGGREIARRRVPREVFFQKRLRVRGEIAARIMFLQPVRALV
jgi:hypothetical protein